MKVRREMKKLVLGSMILLLASTAQAGYQNVENSYNTINVKKVNKTKNVTKNFNTYVNETTINEDTKKRFEVGVGADVTLYEDKHTNSIVEKVTEEYRYDWQNGEHAAYTVVHFNLFKQVKKLFGR